MSFILDALRKAERERRWARVPTLETVHAAPATRGRRRWPWLAAALAVSATAGIVLVRPWAAGPPASEPPAPARSAAPAPVALPVPVPPAVAASAPAPRTAPVPLPEAVAAVPIPPTPRPLPEARAPAPPVPRPLPEARAAAPSIPRPLPEARTPAPPAPAPVVGAPEPAAAPAPAPFPPLTLNALVDSDDPAERLVFINGRKYVEGQTVDGGAVIERITREGVVLSLQGRRLLLR